jgi:uncharacterized protein (DUF111 family)
MKKGRPGIVLSVICEKGKEDTLKEIIFTESTSIGIRSTVFSKDTLVRHSEKLTTSLGEVTFKKSFYRGRMVSCKPESDECRRIASETGLPVKEVYTLLMTEIKNSSRNSNVKQ